VEIDKDCLISYYRVPDGGYAMIQAQAFFDESGSHDGSHIFCLAGYIFRKSQAIKLGHEWRRVLRWKKLPYFHMVDCAHGNGPFSNLTKSERIAVQTKLIDLIKRHSMQGLAITVDPDEYADFFPRLPMDENWYEKDAYGFCAQVIMTGVAEFISRNPMIAAMTYFFEAGHKSATKADKIMEAMVSQPEDKRYLRYAGHRFVEKQKSPQVQAADLLAWQWYTDRRHELEGRPRRKDCESLLQHFHTVVHIDRKELSRIADQTIKSVAILSGRSL
jgi:hypothetical protein